MKQIELDSLPHSFWCSFRWYIRHLWALTKSLENWQHFGNMTRNVKHWGSQNRSRTRLVHTRDHLESPGSFPEASRVILCILKIWCFFVQQCISLTRITPTYHPVWLGGECFASLPSPQEGLPNFVSVNWNIGFRLISVFSGPEALGLQDRHRFIRLQNMTCSMSPPGGNLLDGFQLVANTGEGRIGSAPRNI